jgi:hypothetical protein
MFYMKILIKILLLISVLVLNGCGSCQSKNPENESPIKNQENKIVTKLAEEKIENTNKKNTSSVKKDKKNKIISIKKETIKEPVREVVQKYLKLSPMIFVKDGVASFNPSLKSIIPELALLNDMAYALGKRQEHKLARYEQYYRKNSWIIKYLPGITGSKETNAIDDIPGIFAYNKEKDLMIICFRGSQKLAGENIFTSKDWKANFSRKISSSSSKKNPLFGLLPENIAMHKAYAFRAGETLSAIMKTVKVFWQINEDEGHPEKNQALRFIVTGHSQGSALGTLALAALVHTLGKDLYGPLYANAEQNKFAGYFFSSPRSIMGLESAFIVHSLVGKHNIANQNVEGDPVTQLNMASNFPGFKKNSWKDLGFLLLDKKKDALERRPQILQQWLHNKSIFGIDLSGNNFAPLHYGSRFHETDSATDKFTFDPSLADTTGKAAQLVQKIFKRESSIESRAPNKFAVTMLNQEHLKDVDELLLQGKNYSSWYSPK